MYRVYVYFNYNVGFGERIASLRSEAMDDEGEADDLLAALVHGTHGVTSGGIEVKVDGVGWVLHE